jgi:bifunctional DNA-binding transcriptional regulator/antitoxin component of YhaV-PrlF toxin-antitoxin module
MSTTLVKVQNKGQVTIPSRLRQQAGIADGEYTPAQRRSINARLAKAGKEIKSGRTFGPFDNADDMIASIERELKKRAAARKKAKPSR